MKNKYLLITTAPQLMPIDEAARLYGFFLGADNYDKWKEIDLTLRYSGEEDKIMSKCENKEP